MVEGKSSGGVGVCVTGGAGFIGSWLVKKLLERGYTVHSTLMKYKSTAEAAANAVRLILRQCADPKTVKRVIHTASITSSPLKDSAGYKDFIDESCWTPLNVDYPHRIAQFDEYVQSKLMSEELLLSYNDGESSAFEVVTLPCPVVAGGTLQSHVPSSLDCSVSPVSRDGRKLEVMRQLQALIVSVLLAHVDDVCDALVFCMEQSSMAGQFLCSAV